MEIKLNGKSETLREGETQLSVLMARLGLAGRPALVELNGQALHASEAAVAQLRAGDVVEIIRIVAGG